MISPEKAWDVLSDAFVMKEYARTWWRSNDLVSVMHYIMWEADVGFNPMPMLDCRVCKALMVYLYYIRMCEQFQLYILCIMTECVRMNIHLVTKFLFIPVYNTLYNSDQLSLLYPIVWEVLV